MSFIIIEEISLHDSTLTNLLLLRAINISITFVVHLIILQHHTYHTYHTDHKIWHVKATINLSNINTLYTKQTIKHKH